MKAKIMKNLVAGVTSLLLTTAPLRAVESDAIIDLPVTVVTGELWQSELQQTTASVSVVGASTLVSPTYQHLEDLTTALPNLTTTGGSSRARYFQVRGIGENSQFEGETPDAAVALLVDDLDFTGLGSIGTLLDVRQVELLRGPQAGAFGANAAGGVIRIVSEDPTPFWSGYAQGTIGSDGLASGAVAVGGPLSEAQPEVLSFRVALQQLRHDGYHTNRVTGRDDTNERDERQARLKLRWKPTERWQWDATLFAADMDNGYDVFSMDHRAFETASDEPGRDEQESRGASLKGQFHASDRLTVTSKSAWMQSDSLYSYDADWTDASYAGFLATWRDRKVLTQELRLDWDARSALRWTAGVYVQTLDEDTDVLYRDGDPTGGPWDYGQVDVNSAYATDTVALFGQMRLEWTEATRLVLGLRHEWHDVDFDSQAAEQGYYQDYVFSGSSRQDGALIGGKLTLEHNLDASTLLFASLARGYKAAGANSATFTTPELPLVYDSEELWNVELGLRSWLQEERLSVQLTGFYLLRKDAQLRDSVGAGGFFRYLTVNGEDARHFGMEAELQWKLSRHWDLVAGLSLLDAERDGYTDPGGWVPERKLANAPSWQYHLNLSYQAESGVFGSVFWSARDSYYESNSHTEKRDAMQLLHATVGYRLGNWEWSLWGKNLLDKQYASRVFYFDNGEGDQRYEALADPLQIGTTLRYRF